jgi:hypothetical protein
MLKPRPAQKNKRIRESSLLKEFPFLSGLDVIRAERFPHGTKYAIYSPPLDTYYIAFVWPDGSSKLLARHHGRVEDLIELLNRYSEELISTG